MKRSLYHLFTRSGGRWHYMSSHTPSYYWTEYVILMREHYGAQNIHIRFSMGE